MKVDLKSLDTLEDKIQRTVTLASRLKDENTVLLAKVRDLEAKVEEGNDSTREVESLKLTQDQLERELKSLQDERETVLARVDGILENLDSIPLD